MSRPSMSDWSVFFDCPPEDLAAATRSLFRTARCVEDSTVRLRAVVHESPDRTLDEAASRLERSACDVTAILQDLHTEVVREFG